MTRCEACQAEHTAEAWEKALHVCPGCGFHNPMPARARLALLADAGTLGEELASPSGADPLQFVDTRPYADRLADARRATGADEAFIAAPCLIGGVPALLGAFDFRFMGGTMSSAVGERLTLVFERATVERRALVLCTASGGARMQEGTLALFQMTRTVAALQQFKAVRKPCLTVLGHPTLGGVGASFAMLADVLIAEPGARIGFAGPRVIEQVLGHALPPGFQRAEFLLEHGLIDLVVPRGKLKDEVSRLVRLLSNGQ